MPGSVHTARWVCELAGEGWDLHLFPSIGGRLHSGLKNMTVHDFYGLPPRDLDRSVRISGMWRWCSRKGEYRATVLQQELRRRMAHHDPACRLARVVAKVQPDLVHSLEMQHAGYLVLDAKRVFGPGFPPWMMTPWGSDMNLFARLEEHRDRVMAVLQSCDALQPKSERDVRQAQEYGFSGEMLPILPGNGGLDVDGMQRFRDDPPEKRRMILLKGYQGWAGRALVGLKALEMAAGSLKGYRVAVCSASRHVIPAAELMSHSSGIPIEIIPDVPHQDILRLHGKARISIGLSISDGVPNSMLEAMVMGGLPVESNTSCAEEWIENGRTGLIVPPEEPRAVADALRRAAADDYLVRRAAATNLQLVRGRIEKTVMHPKVIGMYERMLAQGGRRPQPKKTGHRCR